MAGLSRTRGARRSSSGLQAGPADVSPVALLIIDVINDFDYEDGEQVLAATRAIVDPLRRLKARASRAGIPVVYVNDNFGRWRSDFRTIVARCAGRRARGRDVVRRLRPGPRDYFVLKPKHSAFYGTAMDLLLEHLQARTLILTGLLADSCILMTASDAHMRGYRVVVPPDCVSARTTADHSRALEQLRRQIVHSDIRPSADLPLATLMRRAGGRRRRS